MQTKKLTTQSLSLLVLLFLAASVQATPMYRPVAALRRLVGRGIAQCPVRARRLGEHEPRLPAHGPAAPSSCRCAATLPSTA